MYWMKPLVQKEGKEVSTPVLNKILTFIVDHNRGKINIILKYSGKSDLWDDKDSSSKTHEKP